MPFSRASSLAGFLPQSRRNETTAKADRMAADIARLRGQHALLLLKQQVAQARAEYERLEAEVNIDDVVTCRFPPKRNLCETLRCLAGTNSVVQRTARLCGCPVVDIGIGHVCATNLRIIRFGVWKLVCMPD